MRLNIILLAVLILSLFAVFGFMESNFKAVGEYNLNAADDVQTIMVKLPQNTTKTKIEFMNLTGTSDSAASFAVYSLKTFPLDGEFLFNYLKNPVDYVKFEINNSTAPLDRNFELNSKTAKCLVIIVNSGKGKVKVSSLKLF